MNLYKASYDTTNPFFEIIKTRGKGLTFNTPRGIMKFEYLEGAGKNVKCFLWEENNKKWEFLGNIFNLDAWDPHSCYYWHLIDLCGVEHPIHFSLYSDFEDLTTDTLPSRQ